MPVNWQKWVHGKLLDMVFTLFAGTLNFEMKKYFLKIVEKTISTRFFPCFQGANSTFALTLEKDGQIYTDFSPLPNQVFTESSVLIRVNNPAALDYEKAQEIRFKVSYYPPVKNTFY